MSKNSFAVAMALVVATVVLCGPVREAHAVATLEVNVTGQALGETTLQLTDPRGNVVKEDEDSRRAAGYWYWRDARPGTYTLQVLRNGTPVGPARTVQVTDNATSRFRVNAQTGQVATVASGMAPQTMNRFSVGVYGGLKPTPWDGKISSDAGNFDDRGDLDENIGIFGIEGRYYLSPTQQRMQALGRGLFITGTYFHYLGSGLNRLYGNRHNVGDNNDDVGAGMDERWSLMLGVGKQFNIYQRYGLALMIGAHMTRADVAALANESDGGGEDLRFKDTKTLFGPFVGAEIFTAPGLFALFPALQLVLQSRMLWMPDTDVSGESTFTNWDYRAEAEGGPQFSVVGGVRVAF